MAIYKVNYKVGVEHAQQTTYVEANNELSAINKVQSQHYHWCIHHIKATELQEEQKAYATMNTCLWIVIMALVVTITILL